MLVPHIWWLYGWTNHRKVHLRVQHDYWAADIDIHDTMTVELQVATSDDGTTTLPNDDEWTTSVLQLELNLALFLVRVAIQRVDNNTLGTEDVDG